MERRPISLNENTVFPLPRELYQVLAMKGLKLGILVLALKIWVGCYPPLGLSFLLANQDTVPKGINWSEQVGNSQACAGVGLRRGVRIRLTFKLSFGGGLVDGNG